MKKLSDSVLKVSTKSALYVNHRVVIVDCLQLSSTLVPLPFITTTKQGDASSHAA
jgi:hypothetical protein